MSSNQMPTDSVLKRHYEQHQKALRSAGASAPRSTPAGASANRAAPARSRGMLGSLIDKLLGRG